MLAPSMGVGCIKKFLIITQVASIVLGLGTEANV